MNHWKDPKPDESHSWGLIVEYVLRKGAVKDLDKSSHVFFIQIEGGMVPFDYINEKSPQLVPSGWDLIVECSD
jgi:hypothetical protein